MLKSVVWSLMARVVDKSMKYTLTDHNNHEVALERNDKVKDLGVWFDEKLLFREHIQEKLIKLT